MIYDGMNLIGAHEMSSNNWSIGWQENYKKRI